jgi:hypothetical protein
MSKMNHLKGGVDGFSYFSLIFSYFIFKPESSLFEGKKQVKKKLSKRLI